MVLGDLNAELAEALERAGRLGDETKVWCEGMGQWQRLRQVRHMLPGTATDDSASD